jgi:hypothetical protein
MNKQERYKSICTAYCNEFARKQSTRFDSWVGDYVGGKACFDGFVFDFEDVRFDIDTNQPRRLARMWYFANLDSFIKKGESIKYKDWVLKSKLEA